MERLDYRLNEGGVERWVSAEKVRDILFQRVAPIMHEVMTKMCWDGIPYRYRECGIEKTIEYMGPNLRKASTQADNDFWEQNRRKNQENRRNKGEQL